MRLNDYIYFKIVIKILVLLSSRPNAYYMMILLLSWINACVEYKHKCSQQGPESGRGLSGQSIY